MSALQVTLITKTIKFKRYDGLATVLMFCGGTQRLDNDLFSHAIHAEALVDVQRFHV